MQANKDEAERCLMTAKQCINNGQREKALRILLKANKMYPMDEISNLIEFLNRLKSSMDDEKPATKNTSASDSRPRSPCREQVSYTKEQLLQVKKIKECKDFYEVLGVEKDVTDSGLKKAYKKLALQFHPDKNKTPGATEAFKAIGNAFSVLSDPEKRKNYDLYGAESSVSGQRSHHSSGGFSREFEADMSAEDIFNMFFGGGYPHNVHVRRGGRWQRTHHHTHQTQGQAPASSVLVQLFPILLLIFLSTLSSWFVSDPVYSLQPSNRYNVMRKTQNLQVPYYVRSDFNSEYQGNLYGLENAIEEEYVRLLRNACVRERTYKENMVWRARNFGDSSTLRKAQGLSTPSCQKLSDIYT